MTLSQPSITPLPDSGGLAQIAADYVVTLPVSGRVMSIKAGFQTDGASVPEEFWTLLDSSPFDPDVLAAALGHDALYSAELMERAACDLEFENLMRLNSKRGASLSGLYYHMVSLFGNTVWSKHTPESIAAARQLCSLT